MSCANAHKSYGVEVSGDGDGDGGGVVFGKLVNWPLRHSSFRVYRELLNGFDRDKIISHVGSTRVVTLVVSWTFLWTLCASKGYNKHEYSLIE